MKPRPSHIGLFKALASSRSRATLLDRSSAPFTAMRAIYGRDAVEHQDLSAYLAEKNSMYNERHLFRGIAISELDAIQQTQRMGYGPARAAGKDRSLCNPNHILKNTSQLLLSATRYIRYAAQYAQLGHLPGKSGILQFNAPVIVDQELHAQIDRDVYKSWDYRENSRPADMEDIPRKAMNSYELVSKTSEVDALVNLPHLLEGTDFRPTIEDIIQVDTLYTSGRLLSFLPEIGDAECAKVLAVDMNPNCRPRTWSLSILNTGQTNTHCEEEYWRMVALAHKKGIYSPDERPLSCEDAAVAFKHMCDAFPRLDEYTPDHVFQKLTGVPKDIPLGHEDVAQKLIEQHQQFKHMYSAEEPIALRL
jgi:hypothetical protein